MTTPSTRAELDTWVKRPLGELDVIALMVHGSYLVSTLVVALAIDSTGEMHALAIRKCSTENATLCGSLAANIVECGVPANRSIVVEIDGGTALRYAA